MEYEVKNYFSGTSGLLLPVPNKSYYPKAYREKTRLCYYSSLKNSIEINSSFYKIPQGSTLERWREEVPQNFRFTFKLFKGITHAPNLAFRDDDVVRFFEAIDSIGDKKGCILVQFPPSIKSGNNAFIFGLLECLSKHNCNDAWNIAFEFRHASLYTEEIYKRLRAHKFGMVIHDKAMVPSAFDVVQNDFRYLRFHGPNGNYRGSYSDDVLSEYATYIAAWLKDNKQVYVYFNNTMGDAYGNLNTLNRYVWGFMQAEIV